MTTMPSVALEDSVLAPGVEEEAPEREGLLFEGLVVVDEDATGADVEDTDVKGVGEGASDNFGSDIVL